MDRWVQRSHSRGEVAVGQLTEEEAFQAAKLWMTTYPELSATSSQKFVEAIGACGGDIDAALELWERDRITLEEQQSLENTISAVIALRGKDAGTGG